MLGKESAGAKVNEMNKAEEREIYLSGTVSIIVALYNSEPFVEQLLDSIKMQTYRDIEVILVDDGSPDNCGAICDVFAKGDSRFRVIHKENGGVSDARNKGLEGATGEWVMFVDGDDWLEPDCVEYLLRVAILTGSEMAFSTNVFTSEDRTQISADCIEVWTPEEATAFIFYPKMVLGPWNKIYKKSLLDSNEIKFDVPCSWFGEGLYFSTKCAQLANSVGIGRRKVYDYRTDNQYSGTTVYNVEHSVNAMRNMRYIKDNLIIRTKPVLDAVEWHQWKNNFFMLTQIIGSGSVDDYWDEYKYCISSLRTGWPRVLLRSDVNLHEKMKILAKGLFPIVTAKLSISRKRA